MELRLDCSQGMAAIHQQLADALSFPQWYGKNLDALYDCLTVLSTDVTVSLLQPDLLPGLRRVLSDAAERNPHLHVTHA